MYASRQVYACANAVNKRGIKVKRKFAAQRLVKLVYFLELPPSRVLVAELCSGEDFSHVTYPSRWELGRVDLIQALSPTVFGSRCKLDAFYGILYMVHEKGEREGSKNELRTNRKS